MLAKIARPAADGTTLPEKTVADLAKHRHLLAGIGNARYVAMCRFDLAMHAGAAADVDALWPPLYAAATTLTEAPATHFASSWYHMAIGYDCAYYGYLWSEVCAVDAYARFADALDASEGARLRETCLAPGAARAGAAMLRDFLGRDPTEDAYFKRLGL